MTNSLGVAQDYPASAGKRRKGTQDCPCDVRVTHGMFLRCVTCGFLFRVTVALRAAIQRGRP